MNMELAPLLAILLPPLLDDIVLKMNMNIGILNGMVGANKACHAIFPSLHMYEMSNVIEGAV
jgi:hypothetical protein